MELPLEASSGALQEAIQRVLPDQEFSERARRLAGAVAKEKGAETAANELEGLAAP